MRDMIRWTGALALIAAVAGCGGDGAGDETGLSGRIQVDGSSTVYPISVAMAEEFERAQEGDVRVTVSQSGTGGGFKRFCAGETAVSDASRPIKESEVAACREQGIEPIEMEVAMDGITLAVNPENDWVECLTVDEIRKVWDTGSTVQRWSDVRAGFPSSEIKLYGPGTDSGTFDYFTEAINGEGGRTRQDYTASEDDNILVQGVAGDPGALGYFGYSYYEQNQQQLKALGVDDGNGCVLPSPGTIESGEYAPLSRPMYIYTSERALERPEVREFLRFYMENAAELVPTTGYIPMSPTVYQQNLDRVAGPTEAAGDTAAADTTTGG